MVRSSPASLSKVSARVPAAGKSSTAGSSDGSQRTRPAFGETDSFQISSREVSHRGRERFGDDRRSRAAQRCGGDRWDASTRRRIASGAAEAPDWPGSNRRTAIDIQHARALSARRRRYDVARRRGGDDAAGFRVTWRLKVVGNVGLQTDVTSRRHAFGPPDCRGMPIDHALYCYRDGWLKTA